MKICGILILLATMLFTVSFDLPAKEGVLVDNPSIPVKAAKSTDTKTPGRVVELTEMLRISDAAGDFFFKEPRYINVAPDDSLYVMDQMQLLKFDKTGKFLSHMVKQGEGPGEAKFIGGYQPGDHEITVATLLPSKIMHLDTNGKLIKEFRFGTSTMIPIFVTRLGDRYYFRRKAAHFKKADTSIATADNVFFYTTEKAEITEFGVSFSTKEALVVVKGEQGTQYTQMPVTRLIFTVMGSRLYVSSSERYMIHRVDLEKGKADIDFRRAYTPQTYIEKPKSNDPARETVSAMYKPEFFNDVSGLLTVDEHLWVTTSTVDNKKGLLTDVFDADGNYIDSFYLELPNLERPDGENIKELRYANGFLYTIEKDGDDTSTIVKYKVNQ